MPITAEHNDHNILIVRFDGKCPIEDINTLFLKTVFPLCHAIQPKTMHILYDITKLDWTFTEFVDYLTSVRQRREQNVVPENIAQYFLGSSQWADILRDWLNKQYQAQMEVFTDLESALNHIKTMS